MNESATDMAGRCLVSWARREAAMRIEARSLEPRHVQYAGDGSLLLIAADATTVFVSGVHKKEIE